MSGILTAGAAQYLTKKTPFVSDGCSAVDGDDKIRFKFSPEGVSIGITINGIQNDIDTNQLPPGITKEMAKRFIEELKKIAKQDPRLAVAAQMRLRSAPNCWSGG